MSKNIFDLLIDDEEVEKKPTVKAAAPAPVATIKKVSAPKTENKDKSSPKMTGQNRPNKKVNGDSQVAVGGEERQSTKRDSKNHVRQPRTDASGNIRNRQFDRKSGTGRPHNENKKGGAGSGNWGKEGSVDAETNVATPAVEGEKESTESQVVATPAVEDKTITLGEHLKQLQSQSVKSLEAPKLRVAGEGESTAQWEDFEPIQREVVKSRDNKSVKEEKKTKKNFIQVELKPAASNTQRPGQRRNNSGKEKKVAPSIDENSFPSLSKA